MKESILNIIIMGEGAEEIFSDIPLLELKEQMYEEESRYLWFNPDEVQCLGDNDRYVYTARLYSPIGEDGLRAIRHQLHILIPKFSKSYGRHFDFDTQLYEEEILNTNVDMRERILFGESYNEKMYMGGIRRFNQFNNVYASTIKQLAMNNFIDLDENQNNSPTIRKMCSWTAKHPEIRVNFLGYAVSPERNDYRVSIDGMYLDFGHPITKEEQTAVHRSIGRGADEFDVIDNQFLRVWWD